MSQLGFAPQKLCMGIAGRASPLWRNGIPRLTFADKKGLMKYSAKYIITRITGGLIVAGLLAASRAGAADTTINANGNANSSLSSKGSSFVKEAAAGNQAEIALAQLAQQKAQNPEVKNLAEMLQKEHQQSQQKLQTIAQTHGLTLDTEPGWSQKRTQSKLEKLTGAEFDQQYAKDMLEDHVTDIKKYQKAAQNIEDADVKQYAQETLGHLQTHLQHAESAARSAGVDQSTITSLTKNMPAGIGGAGENQETGRGAGQQHQTPQQP
jgi:putative membrane protein